MVLFRKALTWNMQRKNLLYCTAGCHIFMFHSVPLTGTVPVPLWCLGGGLPCAEWRSEGSTGFCSRLHTDCQWNQSSRAASWGKGRAVSQHYQRWPAGDSREHPSGAWWGEGQKSGFWNRDNTTGGHQQWSHCHCGGLREVTGACMAVHFTFENKGFNWILSFIFFMYV